MDSSPRFARSLQPQPPPHSSSRSRHELAEHGEAPSPRKVKSSRSSAAVELLCHPVDFMLKHLHGHDSSNDKHETRRLRSQRGSLGNLTATEGRMVEQRASVGSLSTRGIISDAAATTPMTSARHRGSLGNLSLSAQDQPQRGSVGSLRSRGSISDAAADAAATSTASMVSPQHRGSLGTLMLPQGCLSQQRGSVGDLRTRGSVGGAVMKSMSSSRQRGSLGDLRKSSVSDLPTMHMKLSSDRRLSASGSPRGTRGSIVGPIEVTPPPRDLLQLTSEELQVIRQQLQQTTRKKDLISRAESTKLPTFDESKMGVSIRSRSSTKQLVNGAEAVPATIDDRQRIGSTGEIAIPGLDKAIRRASLTCRQSLDEKDKSAGNSRTDMESYFRLQKRSVFGIYSVREVMGVIRLFHVLDEDNSNTVSLSELQYIRPFFERIGQYDLSKVFHAIDKDNNGQISLRELLESCFPQSSNVQLSKVGNVRQFFRGATEADASSSGVSSLTHENKQELLDIFRIFDKNGDGFVSMDEIMQALRIDDSEHEIERAVAERRRVKLATEGVGAVGVTVTTAAPSSRSMGSSGITRSDMERYYAEYDVNGDKVLDFDEFVELMRALYE